MNGDPPMRVATTARPLASASIPVVGRMSCHTEGITTAAEAARAASRSAASNCPR